jgi:beta-galactosidase
VADGGPDGTITLTGWRMKVDGRGNQVSALAGVAVDIGAVQIAPNLLYQKPLEGPLPAVSDQFSLSSGNYYPGSRPRNILDDPFAVLGNRETLGAELLLVYDPTPGTWLWAWDNLIHEDAPFAGALDFIYRIQPTARDSGVGFTAEGLMQPFHASPPAHDSWEVHGKWVSNPGGGLRLAGDLFVGSNQANAGGSQELDRQVLRYGATLRTTWKRLAFDGFVKVDDWGPYDYHRDYNFTYPLQLMTDMSWSLVKPKWLFADFARMGIRYQMRLTDERSNRFGGEAGERGYEYEVRTYVDLML